MNSDNNSDNNNYDNNNYDDINYANVNTNPKSYSLNYNFKPSKVKSRVSKRYFKKTPPTKVITFEQVPMYDRWANGG
jgi:hypothetical protein